MDKALIALMALLINAALGGPRSLYLAANITRITEAPSQFFRSLERKLNRDKRSPEERVLRGLVVTVLAIVISMGIGSALVLIFKANIRAIELIILCCCLPMRSSWDRISGMHKALVGGNLPAARQELEGTVWRHHALLDEAGVARAGVEYLAIQFAEKILGSIFWYIILGLPGLLMAKVIVLTQEAFVRPPGNRGGFGQAAQYAHSAVFYLPSRMAALLWMVAALIGTGKYKQSTPVAIINGLIDTYPTELALLAPASVMQLSLGGPVSAYYPQWVGEGKARVSAADLKRAQYLFGFLCLLTFIGFGLFA